MSANLRLYLLLLSTLALSWLWRQASVIDELIHSTDFLALLGVTALYLVSHLFRMLRLVLLTLDERGKASALIAAHALTAFPSSFLPFKIGEILRPGAFFQVYATRRKALAVWLAERFGDIVVIAAFILGMYMLNVNVPASMRAVFFLFVLASMFGLFGLFAVASTSAYLNRHLVLTSHSRRGLQLLQASHALRRLELDIRQSVEGRLSAFLLLSVLIWVLEIAALALFIHLFSSKGPDLAVMFASALLASLPGGAGASAFGLYQSLALVALTGYFLVAAGCAARLKIARL